MVGRFITLFSYVLLIGTYFFLFISSAIQAVCLNDKSKKCALLYNLNIRVGVPNVPYFLNSSRILNMTLLRRIIRYTYVMFIIFAFVIYVSMYNCIWSFWYLLSKEDANTKLLARWTLLHRNTSIPSFFFMSWTVIIDWTYDHETATQT